MPDLLEHMYCSQQINIPPNLPYILKQYAKAAIRTQPHDLLFWSAAYFRAKANNLPPPVKDRLEYPPFDSPSRLSPGFLRVLHKQLGNLEYVREEVLYEKWLGVCLVKESLDSMLRIGHIHHRIPWLKFVAIAAGHICSSLSKTMVLICELLTDQPDGGAAWIPVNKFVDLYEFLASLNCGPESPIVKHVGMLTETSSETSTNISSSVAEKKEEPESKGVDEVDSTVGLMVWPDIKPQEKTDRVRSPKAEDEPGASSEVGVEVLDDAKGTVTEIVTLYSVTAKSVASEDSKSPSKLAVEPLEVEVEGKLVLSHSSLQENEDWIKVEAKNLDGVVENKDQPLDLDELVAKSSRMGTPAKSESKAEGKSVAGVEGTVENKENPKEGLNDQDDTDKSTIKTDKTSNADVDSETEHTIEEVKSQVDESNENVTLGDAASQATGTSQKTADEGSDSKNIKRDKTYSEIAVDQTITMANFMGHRKIGYSVMEIRGGRVGDKSLDQIDLEGGPTSSPTMHRLVGLTSDSDTSTVAQEIDNKPYWEYVPGIGPVIPESQVLAVVEYMHHWASKQQGMVGPRNINHLLCPPLDIPPPTEEDPEASLY